MTVDPRALTTERCVLRPIIAADATALHELWSSAGVRRFLWDDQAPPLARAHAVVEQNRRSFREQRHGLWGVRLRGTPQLIAFAGLWPFREPPELELVYGVADHLWRCGYAAEIARAVTTYCFTSLEMSAVRASTDVANIKSIRVLEKLGFRLIRSGVVDGANTAFYELAAPADPTSQLGR